MRGESREGVADCDDEGVICLLERTLDSVSFLYCTVLTNTSHTWTLAGFTIPSSLT